jgi:hypothetical protein
MGDGSFDLVPIWTAIIALGVFLYVLLCALPRCTDVVGANPTRQLSLQPEAPASAKSSLPPQRTTSRAFNAA